MAKKKQWGGKRPNSGRPVGSDGPVVVFSVSLPKGILSELDELCAAKEWKRSAVVADAIRALLKRKKQ